MSTPHQVLGIRPGASLEEIRTAWRRVARETHPDLVGEGGSSAFIAARRAYESLLKGLKGVEPTVAAPAPAPAADSWQAQRMRQENQRWQAQREAQREAHRAAQQRAYWSAQVRLEHDYSQLGYWTRLGLPRWRTP